MKTIRELRHERGMTIEALAICSGASVPSIYKWEAASHNPSVPQLKRLATALGVSMDDIEIPRPERAQKSAQLTEAAS